MTETAGDRIDWSSFYRAAVVEFRVRPDDFWGMTPVEFWWLYPRAPRKEGAETKDWLKWAMEKWPDKPGGKRG